MSKQFLWLEQHFYGGLLRLGIRYKKTNLTMTSHIAICDRDIDLIITDECPCYIWYFDCKCSEEFVLPRIVPEKSRI